MCHTLLTRACIHVLWTSHEEKKHNSLLYTQYTARLARLFCKNATHLSAVGGDIVIV